MAIPRLPTSDRSLPAQKSDPQDFSLNNQNRLFIEQRVASKLRRQWFVTLKNQYTTNPLLKKSGCLSVSSDPETFCLETVKKVCLVAVDLGISQFTVENADLINLTPLLKMMQSHVDHVFCVEFSEIANLLPAGSSNPKLGASEDEAQRAAKIRDWIKNPQNAFAVNQKILLSLAGPKSDFNKILNNLISRGCDYAMLNPLSERIDKLLQLWWKYVDLQQGGPALQEERQAGQGSLGSPPRAAASSVLQSVGRPPVAQEARAQEAREQGTRAQGAEEKTYCYESPLGASAPAETLGNLRYLSSDYAMLNPLSERIGTRSQLNWLHLYSNLEQLALQEERQAGQGSFGLSPKSSRI